jgi:hypothetical protein
MPQHQTLAAALAAFQAELPKLSKDQTAKVKGETNDGRPVNYSYGYADLSQVTEEVTPILGKHGLSFTSFPTVHESGAFILAYTLLHESGETRDGIWPLPDPTRTKPQQLGSAITYARRYALMAVTNTFPGGEDDDGAQAVPTGHDRQDDRPRQQRPQEAPVSAPPTPPKQYDDQAVTEMHGRLDTLELEKAGALYDWMAAKGLHNRPIDFGEGWPAVTATTRLAVRLGNVAQRPDTTVENLSWLRDFADGRGLLKTPVSPNASLGDVLIIHKNQITQAAVDASENAQAMRQSASASWDDPDQSEESAAAQARTVASLVDGDPGEQEATEDNASPGSKGAPGQ